MKINLCKANVGDSPEIHELQRKAFACLLEKYRDFDTNPGAETLEIIIDKMNQDFTDYYFIRLNDENIGAVRIAKLSEQSYRIAPMCILPEYQGKGFAQQTMLEIEALYKNATTWNLSTIKEEKKLCYLYEKMGYLKTGKEELLQRGMTIIYYAKQV